MIAPTVSLTYREQLIALFAGEQQDGEFVTTPCYTVPLAVEIAKIVDPGSLDQLRRAVYGDARPETAVPDAALFMLRQAFTRWQAIRYQHKGASRGL